MGLKLVGLTLVAAGVTLGIAWASGRVTHQFLPVVALLLLLAGASLFGKMHRLAERMRPLVGTSVGVQAWGAGLPGYGEIFCVESVQAFGPGLHVYLRPSEAEAPIHLKVAQPRAVVLNDRGVEIGEAKYVQWAGKKIKRVAGARALVLRTTAL